MTSTRLRITLLVAALAASHAVLADRVSFEVRTDRADGYYVPGETAEFSVTCRGADGAALTAGVVTACLDNFGTRGAVTQRFDLARSAAFLVSGKLDEPGFLRLTLTAAAPHDGSRVWSVGYAPHRIRAGAKVPGDFDAFWRAAREKLAREVPLDPRVTRNAARSTGDFDFYDISFATFGRRVYGFLSVPKDASPAKRYPVRFSVSAAGFGGWSQDMGGSADEIRVFLTAYDWAPRGADWKLDQPKYEALNAAAKAKWGVERYCLAGIAGGRESHFFYPLILGCDRVVDWIAADPRADANRLRYEGTSQGGMFGLILAGLNRRILRAVVHVPAGCDLLGYRLGRQSGWPQVVESQPTADAKAAAEKWAPYFDAASFASRITCPIRFHFGFSDTTCPPPSVWSAYNACPSQEKSIEGGIGMGHGVFGELYAKGNRWLRTHDARELEAATPESQGIPSEAILRWIEVCEKSLDAVHGFVLARHGKVVAEGWWAPQSAGQLHQLYSHSKSFTSSAVGLLVDDGRLDLDERVADILKDRAPKDASDRLRDVRVRDLLTMNYGSDRDHILDGPGNWTSTALSKEFARDPGRRFRYDSDATYLLACIVERRSGMKLMDFLRARLLDPLGIRRDVWTTVSPEGIACGGWGMSMTTRDLSRFAQLYLQEGRWGDRRILSPEWVRLASSCHTLCAWAGAEDIRFGDDDWHRGYGFQFWRCRHGAFRADGAGGQYSIVMPKQDAILSMTASLGDMQAEIDTLWNILLPAMAEKPLPENPRALARLRAKIASLKLKTLAGAKDDPVQAKVLGTTWRLADAKEGFHLKDVTLAAAKGGWTLTVTGDYGRQTIPVGSGDWAKGRVLLDKLPYERMSSILGEQDIASSGAWISPGVFRVKSLFPATIFTGVWTLDFRDPKAPVFEYSAGRYRTKTTGSAPESVKTGVAR